MENPYLPIEGKVGKIIDESPGIKTFIIRPEEPIAFSTGQFMEVTVPGVGEAPFTPSSVPGLKETMEFTIMKVGSVTDAVHELKEGDKVGVRGPFGKGYPLDDFAGKEILIVGGGVGLAPLRSLLYALFNKMVETKKIHLRYGARTPEDIIYKESLKEWGTKPHVDVRITVDKGNEEWKGNVGVVTEILEADSIDVKNSVAVVCGPPIMMKFSTLKLLELEYSPEKIYLSMEKNMSCGIGKCGHCRLDTYYCCTDGPVFTYDKIKDAHEIWD